MKNLYTLFALCFFLVMGHAQQTKRVLFLGNSYTGVNNLPQMVADVAASFGDTLIFDSNTPGGYTLQGHSTNATSLAKIAQGGWDYVVLQEQSQLPSFPYNQFSTMSFPFADSLCSKINAADSCAIPLFYMTWGRKNGDQSNCATWPPVCTYAGMQQLLRERYLLMADSNHAQVAPVGAVWRDLRADSLGIELYASDESHPSLEGSYLAACTFYASIFHKSPVGAAVPGFMMAQDAVAIQQHAQATVFDSLGVWMIDTLKPKIDFVYYPTNYCEWFFDATNSQNVDSVFWDFGDSTYASGFQVSHYYQFKPYVNVCVEAWKGCLVTDSCFGLMPCVGGISETELGGISIFPNPAQSVLNVLQHDMPAAHMAYSIYDITGKKLLAGNSSASIDIHSLSSGIYALVLTTPKGVKRLKFEKL